VLASRAAKEVVRGAGRGHHPGGIIQMCMGSGRHAQQLRRAGGLQRHRPTTPQVLGLPQLTVDDIRGRGA